MIVIPVRKNYYCSHVISIIVESDVTIKNNIFGDAFRNVKDRIDDCCNVVCASWILLCYDKFFS